MANLIHTTASEFSAITPELWSAKYIQLRREMLPFQSIIDRSYEGEFNYGDILNISKMPDFDDASLLAEGAQGQADAVTVETVQLTVNSMAYKDVIVSRKAQVQSLSHMDELRDRMIFSILKKMEQDIIDAFVPSSSTPDHQISYTSGTTLALADILAVQELLLEADCPLSGRHAVLGSAQYSDIFNLSQFVNRDFIPLGSPSPVTTGEIAAPVAGFNIKLGTRVGNTSYWFHTDAMTMAVQDNLAIEAFNLGVDGTRGTRVNAQVLYGIKVLDNQKMVKLS